MEKNLLGESSYYRHVALLFPGKAKDNASPVHKTKANWSQEGISGTVTVTPYKTPNRYENYLREIIIFVSRQYWY